MDIPQQNALLSALEPELTAIIEAAVIAAFGKLKVTIADQIDDAESLAKYLGCSVQTIYGLKNDGVIEFIQVGRAVKFRRQQVVEALSHRKGQVK